MTSLEREAVAVVLATAVNLPFGAWRATVRKFSWRWFVAIHLPIPFIIVVRLSFGLGWWFVPFMFASAVVGQVLGSWLFKVLRAKRVGRS